MVELDPTTSHDVLCARFGFNGTTSTNWKQKKKKNWGRIGKKPRESRVETAQDLLWVEPPPPPFFFFAGNSGFPGFPTQDFAVLSFFRFWREGSPPPEGQSTEREAAAHFVLDTTHRKCRRRSSVLAVCVRCVCVSFEDEGEHSPGAVARQETRFFGGL